jgi:putative aldouronate transport system permease protein
VIKLPNSGNSDLTIATSKDTGKISKIARDIKKYFMRDKYLYLLLFPGILALFIFNYVPMYGVTIAFKEFNIFAGIAKSPWVKFLQFERLFRNPDFLRILRNTLLISLYKLAWGFPAPIILAILLNELKNRHFKRVTQTILYLPHFISWVIFAGLIVTFLNPTSGVINDLISRSGGDKIDFLASKKMFRSILVISEVYKGAGWGTIVYLSAISGIDPQLYEAAVVDGASRFRQIWHITLPSIRSVIVILLILNLGNILNAGFQQVFLLYNPLVYEVGDIIDTFVFRKGIVDSNYSLAAAAGLFKNIIALILIVSTNLFVKKLGEDGLW